MLAQTESLQGSLREDNFAGPDRDPDASGTVFVATVEGEAFEGGDLVFDVFADGAGALRGEGGAEPVIPSSIGPPSGVPGTLTVASDGSFTFGQGEAFDALAPGASQDGVFSDVLVRLTEGESLTGSLLGEDGRGPFPAADPRGDGLLSATDKRRPRQRTGGCPHARRVEDRLARSGHRPLLSHKSVWCMLEGNARLVP